MSQNIWCRFFGLHKYEVLKEEEIVNVHDDVIGKTIISRCTNCGKLHKLKIYNEIGYER